MLSPHVAVLELPGFLVSEGHCRARVTAEPLIHRREIFSDRSRRNQLPFRVSRTSSASASPRAGVPFRIMPESLDLTIVYEDGEGGWVVASIPEVKGVHSQGRTREEARANVIDALRLMLSPEPSDAGDDRERERLHLTIAA